MANSVEHSTEDGMTWDRFEIDSEVTKQDLIDSCTHLSHIKDLMSVSLSQQYIGLWAFAIDGAMDMYLCQICQRFSRVSRRAV